MIITTYSPRTVAYQNTGQTVLSRRATALLRLRRIRYQVHTKYIYIFMQMRAHHRYSCTAAPKQNPAMAALLHMVPVQRGRPSGEHRRSTGRAALRPRSSAISPQQLTHGDLCGRAQPTAKRQCVERRIAGTQRQKQRTLSRTARQYCAPRDNTSYT